MKNSLNRTLALIALSTCLFGCENVNTDNLTTRRFESMPGYRLLETGRAGLGEYSVFEVVLLGKPRTMFYIPGNNGTVTCIEGCSQETK